MASIPSICPVLGVQCNNRLINSNNLEAGYCGLLDGSVKGDWPLPNRNEPMSFVDIETHAYLRVVQDTPFINIMESRYWSSSAYERNYPAEAYYIDTYDGSSSHTGKVCNQFYAPPVRDPKS